MEVTIFYYTGTGNSLWVARTLAREMGGASLVSIPGYKAGEGPSADGIVGLVFPVYIWGVPAPVIRFVENLKGVQPEYAFAVAVNAGQVSNTLVQLKKIMAKNGMKLCSGFDIPMPSNYIPWGGPGPQDARLRKFEHAHHKIRSIAGAVREQACMPVEKGPLWQRIVFSAVYRLSFSRVPEMDRNFRADERCNACGICCRVCPAGNITMQEGKPQWHHRCHQCFACLQWCPQQAVQYGKNTPKYERYHHPEIVLKDVLKK